MRALKGSVAAIPVLHSDLPGPGGTPRPSDRSLIYPYAFRHSYAQRHADAGVNVEILKELLDHQDLRVTQGHYTVAHPVITTDPRSRGIQIVAGVDRRVGGGR